MKRKYVIPDVVAVLLLIGAYYIKQFADRKLGFVRWLNYYGAKFRKAVPTEAVKYIAAACAVIFAVMVLIRFIKIKGALTVADRILAAVMTAAAVYYVYATITIVYAVTPSSFLLVPMIGASSFLFTAGNLKRAKELERRNQ